MSELSHIIYREEVLLNPRQDFNFASTQLYLEWYHMKRRSCACPYSQQPSSAFEGQSWVPVSTAGSFYFGLLFWARVLLCIPEWPRTHCEAQAGPGFMMLFLPRPPECWISQPALLYSIWKKFQEQEKKKRKWKTKVNLQFNVAPVLERRRQ